MPARVNKIRHDDDTRAKIKAAQIINRLHSCIMGEVELSGPQVSAAKTLLGKVLPDLQAIQHEGEIVQRVVSRKPLSAEEWAAQHAGQD
jgi:hypothetical protein